MVMMPQLETKSIPKRVCGFEVYVVFGRMHTVSEEGWCQGGAAVRLVPGESGACAGAVDAALVTLDHP